jgi:flagellar protein FliS
MNASAIYQETAVTTQSKGKLVVLLYDGAISFLKSAADCISQNDLEGKNYYIGRARDIVMELNSVLNLKEGGRVAANLRSLYNFIWRYLGDVNIGNDTAELEKVIHIMDDIRGSWQQIAV